MMGTEYIFIVMPEGCRKSDNTLEPYFLKVNKLEDNSEEITWVSNLPDATAFTEEDEIDIARLLGDTRYKGIGVVVARADKVLLGENVHKYKKS